MQGTLSFLLSWVVFLWSTQPSVGTRVHNAGKYSEDWLFSQTFPYKTSNDLFMDPCKAGKHELIMNKQVSQFLLTLLDKFILL